MTQGRKKEKAAGVPEPTKPPAGSKKPKRRSTPAKPAGFQKLAGATTLSEEDMVRLAYNFYIYHEWMIYLAADVDHPSPLRDRFDKHLGTDVSTLPVLSETFEAYDHVNVQRAIERYLSGDSRTHELVGVASASKLSLSDLIASKQRSGLQAGSVDYVNLPSGPEVVEACVQLGLYFIADRKKRSILFVRGPDLSCGRADYVLEVVATDSESGSALLREIADETHQSNAFRAQVISFADTHIGRSGLGPMVFWQRPEISPEELILPDGLLDVIERHVFGIAQLRDRLRREGHHVKRGLLLHGPPGAGKTHTVRYILGKATDHTVIVLTGAAMRFIRQACALARLLQPAIVVLEDVDLVARNRDYEESGNPILFDVLNQLDGIEDDADIVFVLTTNRADLLEPALAARPGRVDLAIEIPLPADDERRRLLRLYGGGMNVEASTEADVVRRTAGVTASFLRELARKSAVLAAIGRSTKGKIVVKDAHVLAALDELLTEQSALTRVLLGEQGRPPNQRSSATPGWL